jgi:hypothetical protein
MIRWVEEPLSIRPCIARSNAERGPRLTNKAWPRFDRGKGIRSAINRSINQSRNARKGIEFQLSVVVHWSACQPILFFLWANGCGPSCRRRTNLSSRTQFPVVALLLNKIAAATAPFSRHFIIDEIDVCFKSMLDFDRFSFLRAQVLRRLALLGPSRLHLERARVQERGTSEQRSVGERRPTSGGRIWRYKNKRISGPVRSILWSIRSKTTCIARHDPRLQEAWTVGSLAPAPAPRPRRPTDFLAVTTHNNTRTSQIDLRTSRSRHGQPLPD